MYHPEAKSFLVSEAVRGEGAILVDKKGRRFMEKYHPQMELAPRDVVARAIDAEMKRTGSKCVYLDITHKPADFLKGAVSVHLRDLPEVRHRHHEAADPGGAGGALSMRRGEDRPEWRNHPARAVCHREAACTGLHGANRLASNSLLEGLVLAHRAFRKNHAEPQIRENFTLPEWRPGQVQDLDELVVIYHNWGEIRRLMWDYVGIVRTDKRLQRAAARLRNLHTEVQEFYWNFKVTTELLELRNLVTVASLIVDCAISRKESRGLHYTLDYPETDDAKFLRETTMRRT